MPKKDAYGWGGRMIDDAVWHILRHDRGSLWGHKAQVEPALHASGVPAAR